MRESRGNQFFILMQLYGIVLEEKMTKIDEHYVLLAIVRIHSCVL